MTTDGRTVRRRPRHQMGVLRTMGILGTLASVTILLAIHQPAPAHRMDRALPDPALKVEADTRGKINRQERASSICDRTASGPGRTVGEDARRNAVCRRLDDGQPLIAWP